MQAPLLAALLLVALPAVPGPAPDSMPCGALCDYAVVDVLLRTVRDVNAAALALREVALCLADPAAPYCG